MPSAAPREPGDAFDRIPKVELHCHVEGTVRAETVVELARKAGRPLPVDDPADLYRYDSLDLFLAVFWLVQETLVDRGLARVAYESLVDGAAHGLRYREMFFTPARTGRRSGSWDDRRRSERGHRCRRGRSRRPQLPDRRHRPGRSGGGHGAGRTARGAQGTGGPNE